MIIPHFWLEGKRFDWDLLTPTVSCRSTFAPQDERFLKELKPGNVLIMDFLCIKNDFEFGFGC